MPPRRTTSSKILARSRLLGLRRAWRRRGLKVAFTNGVFDLLHAGHVELLERASTLGDVLVIGVNKDASARRLGKGPGRPIQRFRDRTRVLAALGCVDAVVGFAEDTPEVLLSKLKPDILVKGADYRKDRVAGRQYAGRIVLLSLKKGYSTTGIVRKIRTSNSA